MKKQYKRYNSIIINLQKTVHGYVVEQTIKSGTKRIQKLSKRGTKQELYNADSMLKTEYEEDYSQNKSKHTQSIQNNRLNQSQKIQYSKSQFTTKQIPPRPSWFKFENISQRQKDHLPQFFEGKQSKTPAVYMKYRNFIVNTYEDNPYIELSKIACRTIFHGDVCSIIRLYNFLKNEGVIKRDKSIIQGNEVLETSITLKPERQTSKKIGLSLKKQFQKIQLMQKVDSDLKPNYTSKILSKTARSICSKCILPIGLVWFQQKSDPQISLCIQCHNNLLAQTRQNYQKCDVTKNIFQSQAKNKWQMNEHSKLLQVLSVPGKSWLQVMQCIPKKQLKQEIIFHFLQLPSANISGILHPQPKVLTEHSDRLIRIIQQNFSKSKYSQYSQNVLKTKDPSSEILTSFLSEIIKSKLSKFQINLETLNQLDEFNYNDGINLNYNEKISRIRITRNYELNRNKNYGKPLINQIDQDLKCQNLHQNSDNQDVLNNYAFGNFDKQEDSAIKLDILHN